ncbi:hypothetical protein DFH09DRAFT_1104474 [Mycena vulgaris]|nr:hypothetical protein DFH09DRAFT_1104474 [Mycena vulgaris]
MDLLLRSSARWRKIVFNVPSRLVAKVKDINAPRLEAIEVRGSADLDLDPTTSLFCSTKIRSVLLFKRDLGPFMLNLPLAYDHLTHLSLINNNGGPVESINVTLSILRRWSGLLFVQLQLAGENDHAAILGGPVSLPSLQVMTSIPQSLAAGQFLAPLVLASPKLESLEVNLGSFTQDALYDVLRGFPRLITLRLTDVDPQWWDHPNPNVTYVNSDDLLNFLTSGVADVGPALRDIQIANGDTTKERVLVFTATRTVKNHPLHRLHVHFRHGLPRRDSITELQVLHCRSMDLSMEYNSTPGGIVPATPWSGLQHDEL